MKILASGRSTSAPDTAVPPARAPGGELRALTGLRIVAAVWVVVFHFHFTPLPGVEAVSAWLGPLASQGALGVDLFFVLSGFVIAYTHLDRLGARLRVRGTARFVWARAGRMWPAYLVVFHLFGVWLWLRATYGSDADVAFQAVQPDLTWDAWLRQIVLVQMWDRPFLDGASWVGPTWSISAEWLAYLLFPLTALVFFRLRRLPVVVLGLGALLAMAPMTLSFLLVGSPYYPFSWLVRVLCGFSAGVLALLAVRRLTRDGVPTARLRRVASVTAAVAGVGIVGGLLAGDATVALVALLFPVLVGALALADRGPARLLASAPMVRGGRISYALYLVHIPVFEVFWTALRHGVDGRFDGMLAPGSTSAHLVALAVLVIPLGLAHLLYTLVEEPARGWMRDLPRALRRSVPAVAIQAAAVPTARTTVAPVDTRLARLDPRTLRTVVVPQQVFVSHHAETRLELPRQHTATPDDTPDTRPALARVHAVRGTLHGDRPAREAGHGDGPFGDGLAGNLLAAARLRATEPAAATTRATSHPHHGAAPGAGAPGPTGAGPDPAGPAHDGTDPAGTDPAGTGPTGAEPERAEQVPEPRSGQGGGTRTGAERCGRRSRHQAHGSAATPIVAAAAAATRGRRRPSHGLHHRQR